MKKNLLLLLTLIFSPLMVLAQSSKNSGFINEVGKENEYLTQENHYLLEENNYLAEENNYLKETALHLHKSIDHGIKKIAARVRDNNRSSMFSKVLFRTMHVVIFIFSALTLVILGMFWYNPYKFKTTIKRWTQEIGPKEMVNVLEDNEKSDKKKLERYQKEFNALDKKEKNYLSVHIRDLEGPLYSVVHKTYLFNNNNLMNPTSSKYMSNQVTTECDTSVTGGKNPLDQDFD